MTITPNPVPEGRASRTRYAWDRIELGVWQNWPTVAEDETLTDEDALKRATRVRLAARDYATRHGLKVESRRSEHGRVLDLRFTRI